MDLGLKGKKVLITGATRGIGYATAMAFANEGADIALCARNKQQIEATLEQLSSLGVNTYGSVVDVSDYDALQNFIDNAAQELGGIDIVMANPSAFAIGTTLEDWQAGFAVDLMSTVKTIKAALPYLEMAALNRGDAAILVLSSAAIAETDMESAYAAYKAGLVHYAKGLARRLAAQGIRVNTLSPGTIYVENGFWGNAKQNVPELYEHFFSRNPMGRMGEPNEIAKPALFLCSSAASFITGSNLVVDGAWTSRVNY